METLEDASLLRDMLRELILSGRLWRKMARKAAAKHGVSEAASSPLLWIARLGDDTRQRVLAEAIGVEGASLVRLIDELEASGLVIRAADPSDKRANFVKLTERGKMVVEEVRETLAALRLEVFKDISRDDIEATLRICGTIEAADKSGTAG